MTAPPEAFDRAAWSWVDHLRHGGSTPWADWSAPATGQPAPPGKDGSTLPAAAELEVVRRLATRPRHGIDFPAVADLVLRRSGPGRGLVDIPLAGTGRTGTPRIGTPPSDPGLVPDGELVRVAVGALAELLIETPATDPTDTGPSRMTARRRPWERGFRIAGPPVAGARLRASLAAAGHVEGGRRPRVLLVAGAFDEMLLQIWSSRVQRGSTLPWPKLVRRLAREDRVPLAMDLPRLAGQWADRVGAERVHVIIGGADPGVWRTAAQIVGGPVPPIAEPAPGDVADLSPRATDVLRRVNEVLNVRVDPARLPAVVRAGSAVLQGPGPALVVPDRQAAWAAERSRRMAQDLRAGRYAVHGEPGQVASRRDGDPDRVHAADVLDIALDACLRAAEQSAHGGKVPRR
ncbi:MAG TPA: hypothetical protein VFG63_03270 [Nocardioidaceae bacterium]|nr:hypothetical protein [Nocardioidaceae bacterium]